ncbi:pyruvate, phosphate dikinase [Mesorhizobium sp. M2D.F.Ca.ET.185.01.1.1]|uniref:pyruvate, phosphate dikinase n=1 Tax=unclassified Mesorhizobium TaxID=325217 RepID=UPI000FCC326C|nr:MULTISPECIES: pyruvate, phosphate dikinase [unclassified Mesorhizobium]TGP76232.1 pyruvate, phosphate dikinase [bacterium M00.F.Ca.ET.227.01.1.1]TGP92285.1 pyruvate, phosphate dikinase [bacterium M00.F.Ca.ET.222.01.1.1]TGP96839.1 pyruvate, phosphate dikinase [bacterium M00.F.Ca.ET.221.01.1.1]TGU06698.1 pyruvate, phosphate dikinase [bacterium M00.F.Ca.ET.163.01.1.1]TGU27672.1 pyruvate, phosphate dikinase [bacterium M00.F.Ca.ET.156.01.1.1]TGU50051.1 pyruvate, phosphate dikinase [bacterium M0
MTKWVYTFGDGAAEGGAGDRNLLGGKGANLAEMCSLGLPVPPGFTITTEVCNAYYANGRAYPDGLEADVITALDHIGRITGRRFGDPSQLLLVSVRSGARASMPGMMDTVLNLGLNDETVEALAADSGDARFAYDSYRRFIQMYSDVVMGLDHEVFEEILEDQKASLGHELDTELTAAEWQGVISLYKAKVEEELGKPFPQDPREQLWGAIGAVFSSWMNNRAITYRRLHDIPESWGTAVNVQAMVFGNMGDTSATGVAFTRNPSTGDRQLYGEFLVNAQGEDVVAGIRTPQNITEAARIAAGSDKPSLQKLMPDAFQAFVDISDRLEKHYRDMQDLEFTIERGKLWMLQTRSGKRTAKAALKIAVEMARDGLITKEEAVARIDAASLDQLLHPTIDPKAARDVIGMGLPASPGAATGEIVFSSADAEDARAQGRKVILVRIETSPEDIHGMHAAEGILTTRGGMTSHAAVVARGMGKPCVSGAGSLRVDYKAGTLMSMGQTFRKGDIITIDGGNGQVLKGAVAMLQPELSGDFAAIMEWADAARRMKVRTNAETPLDARMARSFGAEGIGLCRTEHMFFDGARIVAMREMILADTEKDRRAALDKLLPMQRSDFLELFEIMAGLPVTIRLLDPPLHEFLPKTEAELAEVAAAMNVSADKLRQRTEALHEFNPMLGHRGCRLAVSYPEIAEMQARAIFEAAVEAGRKAGALVVPEIMVPLVGLVRELEYVKARIDAVAQSVMQETGIKIDYLTGTMIELPRAAIRAHVIAEAAEFFSFGTNDLTQTTFGISRDDAASFLETYRQKGIIEQDPFVSLDIDGVGELVRIAAEKGKTTRPGIKLGICGEHGGDPASIRFCEQVGLDYVSCSPYRVPIARLAAAQAAVAAAKGAAKRA